MAGRVGGKTRRRRRRAWQWFQNGHPCLIKQTTCDDDEFNVTDSNKIKLDSSWKHPNILSDVKRFFACSLSFPSHLEAQNNHREHYAAALQVLQNNGEYISQIGLISALAAAWARRDHHLVMLMLAMRKLFTITVVTKAVSMLDSGRKVRAIEKRVKRLKSSGMKIQHVNRTQITREVTALMDMKPKQGSASGAVCRYVRSWVQAFTKSELEAFVETKATHQWKILADICHFHPKKHFPALPWFLPHCYGADPPEDSILTRMGRLKGLTVNDMVNEEEVPLKMIEDKHLLLCLTRPSKVKIANYARVEEVLRKFTDLATPEVDALVTQHLEEGHKLHLSTAELAEIILKIKNSQEGIVNELSVFHINEGLFSQEKTREADVGKLLLPCLISKLEDRIFEARDKMPEQASVMLLCDTEGMFPPATGLAKMVSGLLAMVTGARIGDLTGNTNLCPTPTSVSQILEWATESDGLQIPGVTAVESDWDAGASLQALYDGGVIMKTFIIVTGYNLGGKKKADRLLDIFEMYHCDVYPADMIIVNFRPRSSNRLYLSCQLRAAHFKDLAVVFDVKHLQEEPDDKFNVVLELLSSRKTIDERVSALAEVIKAQGLSQWRATLGNN